LVYTRADRKQLLAPAVPVRGERTGTLMEELTRGGRVAEWVWQCGTVKW